MASIDLLQDFAPYSIDQEKLARRIEKVERPCQTTPEYESGNPRSEPL